MWFHARSSISSRFKSQKEFCGRYDTLFWLTLRARRLTSPRNILREQLFARRYSTDPLSNGLSSRDSFVRWLAERSKIINSTRSWKLISSIYVIRFVPKFKSDRCLAFVNNVVGMYVRWLFERSSMFKSCGKYPMFRGSLSTLYDKNSANCIIRLWERSSWDNWVSSLKYPICRNSILLWLKLRNWSGEFGYANMEISVRLLHERSSVCI